MGSRSRIGILRANGTIRSIYCNFDGSPDVQLPILKEHYGNKLKVQALLALGNICSLGEELGPIPKNTQEPFEKYTVAYYRDFQEPRDECAPMEYASIKEMLNRTMFNAIEYYYLFDETKGEWTQISQP